MELVEVPGDHLANGSDRVRELLLARPHDEAPVGAGVREQEELADEALPDRQEGLVREIREHLVQLPCELFRAGARDTRVARQQGSHRCRRAAP